MPRYHYDVSISRQKRFIRRFKEFMVLLAGMAFIAGIVIGIDAIRQATKDNTQQGVPSTSEVRASISEFDSDFFSFSAPSRWRNIKEETTSQIYVYRSFRGALVENELKIYVNSTGVDNLAASRVMPVRIDESNGHIIPAQISDHCSQAAGTKEAKQPINVTIEQASFLCLVDDTNFTVIVAEKGGSTSLKLKRNDGSLATYNFYYRSSTTPPETTQLIDILNSFDAL